MGLLIRRLCLLLLGGSMLAGCVQLGMRYASLKVAPPDGVPEIGATSLGKWEREANALRTQFADYMYGTWPTGLAVEFGPTRVVDADYLDGRGRLEETMIFLGKPDADGKRRSFPLVVAYPNDVDGPVPVIIGQTFSSNCQVFTSLAVTAPNGGPCTQTEMRGFTGWAVKNVLGRWIGKAPVAQYFDRGYAYANFYASTIVPDSPASGERVMAWFRANNEGITASSALSYWGYGWSSAIDFFHTDERIDTSRIGIFGHSRHGKSALVAGAWDKRIDLIISHQSGFGGASMNRSKTGERLDRVAKSYPHWFTGKLQDYGDRAEALPVEQHQLLALVAPTPLLLGNGRRDVWSDPNSAFEAAVLADPVYELYGGEGLNQAGLRDFNPAAALSFSMTSGSHGTTPEDIDMFFAFIDAHFARPQE